MELRAENRQRITKMICPVCEQEFSFHRGRGNHKRIFCSEKCRNKEYQKRIKIAYQEWKNEKNK